MTPDAATPVPLPDFSDIQRAAERIRGVATRTPLEHSAFLSEAAGVPVYLKLECWQRARSFKLRGAYNALSALDADTLRRGIVTASAGNHGQAVALAGSLTGCSTLVFVPRDAPTIKKDRIRAFGATLDESSETYDDAERAALAYASDHDIHFISAFSDPFVAAGQGTVALEIAADLPELWHVVVPVGGGGLSTGIGVALRTLAPDAGMICVQSDQTRAMYDAFAAGMVVDSPIPPTIADGLAGCTDATAYAWLRSLTDTIHLVPEIILSDAIRRLYVADGIVAEGSGIVGVAAILNRAVRLNGPTAVVISGGNIDPARLSAILQS
ncbi:MAG: pyridoxal-phosphate dependent enzyme [Longimicrobiales bacterium]